MLCSEVIWNGTCCTEDLQIRKRKSAGMVQICDKNVKVVLWFVVSSVLARSEVVLPACRVGGGVIYPSHPPLHPHTIISPPSQPSPSSHSLYSNIRYLLRIPPLASTPSLYLAFPNGGLPSESA